MHAFPKCLQAGRLPLLLSFHSAPLYTVAILSSACRGYFSQSCLFFSNTRYEISDWIIGAALTRIKIPVAPVLLPERQFWVPAANGGYLRQPPFFSASSTVAQAMSDISDRADARSEPTPTLPDIEPQAPLSLFQHRFGFDGDCSLGSGPEVYAVPDAVKDPGSTEVPRAVPIVEEQPRGSAINHEAPVIGKGQRTKSKSSNSSSSSQSTSRPVRSMPAIAVAQQTSTGSVPGDATPIGKQTTFVMRVPEEAAVYEVPITRRRSTTIKITVDNGSDESAHMRKASSSEFKTGTMTPSRRPISKANSASPLQSVPIIKEDDTSTKRSKRSRIRALWRRLVAKIMMMKARKKASAPQTNV